jgi:hypothetical protein
VSNGGVWCYGIESSGSVTRGHSGYSHNEVYKDGSRCLKVAKLVLLMQTGQDAQPFIMARSFVLTGQPIIGRFLPLSIFQTLPTARCSFSMYSSGGTVLYHTHLA